MLARLNAADLKLQAGETEAAAALLDQIAATPALEPRYRDLALLKSAMARFESAPADETIAALGPLTAEGAPYQPLATEILAAAYLKAGDREAARARLAEIALMENAPAGVLGRARIALDALGGPPDAADPEAPTPEPSGAAAAEEAPAEGDETTEPSN